MLRIAVGTTLQPGRQGEGARAVGAVEGLHPRQCSQRHCADNAGMPQPPTLILASTSRYRRELLQRLRLPFDAVAPEVDETPAPGERPLQLAMRLALAKARAVSRLHPAAIVIGSDQVAELDGLAIGKPGTHERAVAQLQQMRGRRVVFHTAVAVARADKAFEECLSAEVAVKFRALDDGAIDRYLRLDTPYDCAGSAKCESLGVALLDAIDSDDPTALVGLPLIRTCALLRRAGLDPLQP
jgi:septum formation protein